MSPVSERVMLKTRSNPSCILLNVRLAAGCYFIVNINVDSHIVACQGAVVSIVPNQGMHWETSLENWLVLFYIHGSFQPIKLIMQYPYIGYSDSCPTSFPITCMEVGHRNIVTIIMTKNTMYYYFIPIMT